jgi:hypothetical protein
LENTVEVFLDDLITRSCNQYKTTINSPSLAAVENYNGVNSLRDGKMLEMFVLFEMKTRKIDELLLNLFSQGISGEAFARKFEYGNEFVI